MYELKINGVTNFMGIEIPIVEGGFGEGKRCILAKDIAKIHEVEPRVINQSIQRNIDEFEIGVDIIDLKQVENCDVFFKELGFTQAQIGNANKVYLLSESGYMTLCMFMRTKIAKEKRQQFKKEYFIMREIINSDEVLKSKALLMAMEGTSVEERIHGISKYAELITKPLKEKNKALEDTIDNIVDTNISYESLRRELVANLKEISKILHNSKFQKTYSEFYKFLLDNGYNLELRRTNRKKKIINEIDDLDIDIAKVQDEINRVTVEMLVFNKSDGDYKELSNLKKKYLKELSEHKKIQRRLLSEFNKLEKGSKLDLIKEDEYKNIIVITRAWSLSNGYTNWKEKLDVKNDNTPLPF